MTAAARTGIGATLTVTSTSPNRVIGEILNIDGPQEKLDVTDATTLDSIGGYKENIPGLKEGGSISLPILWRNTAAQRVIRNLFGALTPPTFALVLPTSPLTTITFSGNVDQRGFKINPKDPMQVEIKINITGAVIYAPP